MKRLIKVLTNLVLVGVIIISVLKISDKILYYAKDEKTYKEIQENFDFIDREELLENYMKLKEKNSDYKFWLNIDNTNIDYPVVQTIDNSFYLTNDFYKVNSKSGCAFVDYRNNINEDKNILIYGHNMRNNTLFNNLEKFKDEEFFSGNNNITIIDENGIKEYEVFSVYVVKDGQEIDDYLTFKFSDDENYKNYIDKIKNKSLYKNHVEVNEDDKIITLFTCSYEYKDARTIVHGKLKE